MIPPSRGNATLHRLLQLGFAASLLCSTAEHARADKPNLLVLPYQAMNKGVSAELAEQTTVVVAHEIEALGLEVARADDVADSTPPTKSEKAAKNTPSGDPAAAERAQELIVGAKKKLDDSDVAPAIEQLKKAVKLLEDNGEAVPDLRLLAEAYLQLGVAHFRESDEDAADQALTQAVHLAPTRELEETEYPPIFIRVFQRVRYNVLRRPRATLQIRGPAGAQVLLDGRNLGKAPLDLTEVLPGNHWVRVEKGGAPAQVKKVAVKSKKTTLVEFEGAPAAGAAPDSAGVLGAVGRNQLDKSQVEQLRAAGKRAGAQLVLVGGIHKTETAYGIYTLLVMVSDGSAGRATEVAFDLDMLTAQIEVFKLAEDVKKQLKTGKLSTPITEPQFALAPKLDSKSEKRAVVVAKETKIETAIAAPPAISEPKEWQIAGGEEHAPLGAAAPVAAATAPVTPRATLEPKDELARSPATNPVTTAPNTAVIPADDVREDRSDGTPWWVWGLVGVAVAGAAGAGGYLLLSSSSPNEGTLRIHW